MLFTVIIPVYNAEKYLPQALDSVLAQTFTDYECVCVNDGSTDSSAAILTRYEQKFQEVGLALRIVTKENGGVSSARNAGLDAAQGEYITWFDADDIMAPTRFEVAAKIVDRECPDLVRFCYQMGTDEEVEGFRLRNAPARQGKSKVEDSGPDCSYETLTDPKKIFHWGWEELNGNGMGWLWFAKRELLGLPSVPTSQASQTSQTSPLRFRSELRVKEDCVFSSSLIPKIRKLCICKDQGLFYRQIQSSAMHVMRKAQDCINCQHAFFDLWNEQKDYAEAVGELGYLQFRLRRCSQSDLLDWVRMRPKDEGPDCARQVRKAYLKMARSGAYSNRWAVNKRYWPVLPIYEMTGWIWPIECVEAALRICRTIIK